MMVVQDDIAFAQERELKNEIIYHILVDRFNNGNYENDEQVDVDNPNTYHGGDLEGIILKLDELKEMGITTISLSPIMDNSEDGYHGYWIEDFYEVEEQFGTMEDMKTLVQEAHHRDMKVILEFVANYVSPNHSIVTDPNNQNWYKETSESGPDWLANTVKLNVENPEVEEYLIDVAKHWVTETGVDGLNLHAVDQAPINFLNNFTSAMKDFDPNLYLIGDTLLNDENADQILEETEIQAIENNNLFEKITDIFSSPDKPLSELHEAWEEEKREMDILYVDNKDTERFTQRFTENGRNAVTTWTLALTYLYTTPGVPVIYQGSEIPMYGTTTEQVQSLVLFNSKDQDLQASFKRIASIRSQFPALQYGDYELVDSSGAMSVFKRSYEDETIYVAINNDSESQYVTVSDIDEGMELRGYLGDNIVRENEDGGFRIGIPRESVEVYKLQPETGFNWGLIVFVVGILSLFVIAVVYLSIKQRKRLAEEE